MSDVYIVGIDMLKFGRFPNRTVESLGAEALLGALKDCDLQVRDIQALYASNLMTSGEMVGQKILREVGLTGIPVSNVVNACASGANALRDAFLAVKSGVYDIVVAVGAEQMPLRLTSVGKPRGVNPEGVFGSVSMPSIFAEAGTAHTMRYGTSFEQFAKVSVKNHHHATMNPKAMYRIETPLEQVMGSEMISYPNTKLMCSVNVDGAAAAVLMSETRARQLGLAARAARIRASVLASEPYSPLAEMGFEFNGATQVAAKAAYEMAGLGPQDLHLVELHDCFATAELLHYENLGLCGAGEAGRLIDEGTTALGGPIPVNVSGGLLSKGHPVGATGIANVYELVTHLRGEAGERQVAGARIGLAHVVGIGFAAACGVHVLEKV
jgi:acetyl-CoA acetyltransferase